MKAIIVLEDGTSFTGESFGAEGEAAGEAIFNTQVVGYQEILTDPANQGKIVIMGYPHIGNYGINERCFESDEAQVAALVIKEYSKIYSNWQAKQSLADFLKKHKIIGVEGIDTRALTIHLRDHGEQRAVVSTKEFNVKSLAQKAKDFSPNYQLPSSNNQSSSKSPKANNQTVIIDLGVNKSTLAKYPGAKVVSGDVKADEILAGKPEQVIISSGPQDPRQLSGLVGEVKKLIGQVPIYGIQNGACVLAIALGGTVNKMKVGHHGVNHPVVEPKSGRGEISVQNHSYGLDQLPAGAQVSHVNLNDKSIEKFQTKDGLCVGTLYFPIDERGKLAPGYQYVM
jgi:carbamoyl-phosphate synthase small subunit